MGTDWENLTGWWTAEVADDVAYRDHYGEAPPKPYGIAILRHAHYIPVPDNPFEVTPADCLADTLKMLRELQQ